MAHSSCIYDGVRWCEHAGRRPTEKVTGGRYMQAGKQNNAKPGAILIVETTEQGRRSDTVLYLWEAVPFFVACLLTQIA
jgi:hypothetical protein